MAGSDDILGRIMLHGPSQGTLFLILNRMREEGRFREVIQGCLKALSVFPDDFRLRKLLADAYLEVGFISQAEGEMEKIAAHIAELAGIFKRQAEILERQRRPRQAIGALSIYLAFHPDDREVRERLEGLTAQSAPSAAGPVEPEEEQAPVFSPEMATPTLAEICFAQGRIPEAIGIYERYLSRRPEDESASGRLAEIRASLPASGDAPLPERADLSPGEKTEKMIAVLEHWLEGIRELARGR
jgi:tetratricopeptide (TPR) repeat protein